MAHKTLISGTAYSVTGGRELIGGTGYGCKAGKTLIGGTAFTVPFAKGILLSTITPGAILYLNESGSPVPFYIAKHDYESGLNGAGRTLVVRKDCYDMRVFSNDGEVFKESALHTWLNNTYLGFLSQTVKSEISTIRYASAIRIGPSSAYAGTSSARVIQLSGTELGGIDPKMIDEGSVLPIANTLKIAYRNGTKVNQWTRSIVNGNPGYVFYFTANGGMMSWYYSKVFGSRPAFTLPADTAVIANADGTYTLAA